MNLPDIKTQLFRQLGERMKLEERGAVAKLWGRWVGRRR
jgi:hypothetical protein